MRLQDKVGIVTGGGGAGGSGLGAAIARTLAREGARVVVTDRDEPAAAKVAAQIREAGGDAIDLGLDVTDEVDWTSAVAASTSHYGRVDMLVNNVGLNAFGDDPLDLASWDQVFTTNTRGVFLGMRYVIPEIAEAGGGAVVNITSAAGSVGVRGMHMAYGASKAAIRQMTRTAAVEFGPQAVRVNAVAPSMLAREPGTGEGDARIPLGRVGTADDITPVVVFALSEDGSYVTGTELLADGGYLALR